MEKPVVAVEVQVDQGFFQQRADHFIVGAAGENKLASVLRPRQTFWIDRDPVKVELELFVARGNREIFARRHHLVAQLSVAWQRGHASDEAAVSWTFAMREVFLDYEVIIIFIVVVFVRFVCKLIIVTWTTWSVHRQKCAC